MNNQEFLNEAQNRKYNLDANTLSHIFKNCLLGNGAHTIAFDFDCVMPNTVLLMTVDPYKKAMSVSHPLTAENDLLPAIFDLENFSGLSIDWFAYEIFFNNYVETTFGDGEEGWNFQNISEVELLVMPKLDMGVSFNDDDYQTLLQICDVWGDNFNLPGEYNKETILENLPGLDNDNPLLLAVGQICEIMSNWGCSEMWPDLKNSDISRGENGLILTDIFYCECY